MKSFLLRVVRLFIGLFLFAFGTVLTIKADIGYTPWEVFHSGFAQLFGTQIGTMTIAFGVVILIFTVSFGEQLGIGTLANMVFVGLFTNLLLSSGYFTVPEHVGVAILQMIVGLFVMAFGSYFYIASSFGAGPRDSLMVLVHRKTGIPVGVVRSSIEAIATVIGYFLGGMFGWGTLLGAVGIGFAVQVIFTLFKFDPKSIVHENLPDTFSFFFPASKIGK